MKYKTKKKTSNSGRLQTTNKQVVKLLVVILGTHTNITNNCQIQAFLVSSVLIFLDFAIFKIVFTSMKRKLVFTNIFQERNVILKLSVACQIF